MPAGVRDFKSWAADGLAMVENDVEVNGAWAPPLSLHLPPQVSLHYQTETVMSRHPPWPQPLSHWAVIKDGHGTHVWRCRGESSQVQKPIAPCNARLNFDRPGQNAI